jgi:hypothetical protein
MIGVIVGIVIVCIISILMAAVVEPTISKDLCNMELVKQNAPVIRRRTRAVIRIFGHRGGRKSKGMFGALIDGQKQTEKRNSSHKGVMSSK